MAHITLQRQLLYANAMREEVLFERYPIAEELFKFWDGDYSSLFDDRITKRRLANEIFYQLTRAYNEENPQEGVYNNFYTDINYDLRNSYGTDVCMCCMWIVLDLQESLPTKITAFKNELENVVHDVFALESAKDFSKKMRRKGKLYKMDFSPCPVAPENLTCNKEDDWALATEGFDKKKIKEIINRYYRHDQRIAVFHKIEQAFPIFQQLSQHPESRDHVNIHARHRDRKFYFWFFFDNADRADSEYFANLLVEIEKSNEQLSLFQPTDTEIVEGYLKHVENDMPKNQEAFAKWIIESMDSAGLKQELAKSEAKADMLAKENDQLKAKVKELEGKLSAKNAKIEDLKAHLQNPVFNPKS